MQSLLKLTSADSIKISKDKVIDSYDGHCLRSFYYFKDKMPDIAKSIAEIKTNSKDSTSYTENRVRLINSIKEKHKDLRQASKPVTFA